VIENLIKLKDYVPFFQSFLWIIFISFLLILFKQTIKVFIKIILKRIENGSSLKAGPVEIGPLLSVGKSKVPDELNSIESKVLSLSNEIEVKNEITKDLQSLKNELMTDVLDRIRLNTTFDRIKKGTTFLWGDLIAAYEKRQTNFNSEIREGTLVKIKKELEILKNSKLLNYSYIIIGNFKNESVFRITINMDNKLFELIKYFQEKSWYIE